MTPLCYRCRSERYQEFEDLIIEGDREGFPPFLVLLHGLQRGLVIESIRLEKPEQLRPGPNGIGEGPALFEKVIDC